MSCYWGGCDYSQRRQKYYQNQEQDQLQAQLQAQAQAQLQGQDQDQNQRNVFKEIGNVNIRIDNENIAVAVLAILAVLLGGLDGAGVQTMLDKYLPTARL
jgi:pSer/pThr/pTyr-binding forkhead associated (FHA) protein